LIGRWGVGTHQKVKGITSDILLSIDNLPSHTSLKDGRQWRSYPGLHGEFPGNHGVRRANLSRNLKPGLSLLPTWSSYLLLLHISLSSKAFFSK